ncbi:Thiol-disulfide oxidoreductase ResA [Polaribacter huanghezhanensis]|uniref:TlpA family protein disulfide reductase n=1 Tax=Polaribacter huanghezhanensis TaxID=1354726 RepID=UPI002649C771|nr:TlpA disulfide reductase family protein [Polaribacter huanghezhanensis]WKD86574.1 Thiol-disulfide oxidoreductase ResA [Polaribacter huanghezhanensis]
MKITKKHITNIAFVVLIGLMIYPPTKVFFIRLISFSPSEIKAENQQQIKNTNWQLKGLNTKNINLKELDNKVVFVSFWATWCGPCLAEMPSIKILYDDYKDKVTFLFVTNEDWQTVSKFYTKKKFDFPTYNQLTMPPSELESSSIPATFILDKNKKIVIDKRGPADWDSSATRKILDDLLN